MMMVVVIFQAGFIAGQLNSTRRRVELRRGSVHSDTDATGRRVVEACTQCVNNQQSFLSVVTQLIHFVGHDVNYDVNYDFTTHLRFYISHVFAS